MYIHSGMDKLSVNFYTGIIDSTENEWISYCHRQQHGWMLQ